MSTTQTPKTCTRCNGKGTLEGFGYIDGGRCWSCLGAGTLAAQKAAKPFITIKSVRIERKNSLGGPIDISIAQRDGIYRVAVATTDGATTEVFATEAEARTAANAAYRTAKETI